MKEFDVENIILNCIKEFDGMYGKSGICRILIGAKRLTLSSYHEKARNSKYYGLLSFLEEKEVLNKIKDLEIQNKIMVVGDYDVIGLARKEVENKKIVGNLSIENSGLVKLIKDYCYEKSKEKHIPMFYICENKYIEELAKLQPTTEGELMKVKGFGRKRIEKYGSDLIEIIKNYKKERVE